MPAINDRYVSIADTTYNRYATQQGVDLANYAFLYTHFV